MRNSKENVLRLISVMKENADEVWRNSNHQDKRAFSESQALQEVIWLFNDKKFFDEIWKIYMSDYKTYKS